MFQVDFSPQCAFSNESGSTLTNTSSAQLLASERSCNFLFQVDVGLSHLPESSASCAPTSQENTNTKIPKYQNMYQYIF